MRTAGLRTLRNKLSLAPHQDFDAGAALVLQVTDDRPRSADDGADPLLLNKQPEDAVSMVVAPSSTGRAPFAVATVVAVVLP